MNNYINLGTKLLNFQCYFIVFFYLFGPKISLIDLSILIPFALLLPITNFSTKYYKPILVTSAFIAVLLGYQAIVQIAHQVNEPEPLLRLIRATLVCVIGLMITCSPQFTQKRLLSAIFYSLLLHALLINIAAVLDPLNELLASVSGNDRWKPLRSSGLLAGFDIAGLLCIVGTLMLCLKIYKPRYFLLGFLYYVVFGVAAYFSSRISIALFAIIVIPASISGLLHSGLNFLIKLLIFGIGIILFSSLFYIYILPIIDVTFSLGLIVVSDSTYLEIVSRHAVQSDSQFLWSDMFFIPGGISETLFGIGVDALYSDVGYIKDIFRYGIVGALFSYIIYYNIFKVSVRGAKRGNMQNYVLFLAFIFGLTFLLSLKNSYFFTRALFPLTILLMCLPGVRSRVFTNTWNTAKLAQINT